MKKEKYIRVLMVLVCGLFWVGSAFAAAGFEIPRSVIGGGGQPSMGGGYILNGTVGEPIASNLTIGHAAPGLSSGFWWPSTEPIPTPKPSPTPQPDEYQIFLPLTLRD